MILCFKSLRKSLYSAHSFRRWDVYCLGTHSTVSALPKTWRIDRAVLPYHCCLRPGVGRANACWEPWASFIGSQASSPLERWLSSSCVLQVSSGKVHSTQLRVYSDPGGINCDLRTAIFSVGPRKMDSPGNFSASANN